MATTSFNETSAGGQAKNPACAAFACAVLGFRVFPLVSGTKRPAVSGWQEIATTSLAEVQYMWCGEFQDASVGIATGEGSDLFVLDIDVKNGINGFDSLQRLRYVHGAGLDLFSRTMVVATPSGGAHLYFRWPESGGVVNSSNEIGEGLDVRGLGGLVHAPGWGGYAVVPREGIRRVEVAAAPDWLVELCRKKPKRSATAENDPNGGPGSLPAQRTLDLLGAAPRGTRNNALNTAAYHLGRNGELSHDDAWQECRLIMVSIGANDSEPEQRRTFESGWNDGVAERG